MSKPTESSVVVKAQETPRLKFIEAMPNPKSFLSKDPIASGESILQWFGKLQGQIANRLKAFYNDTEELDKPTLVRWYQENDQTRVYDADAPLSYVGRTFQLSPEQRGKYHLTAFLVVGCNSSSSEITCSVLLNGKSVLPTPISIRVPHSTDRIPVTVHWSVSMAEGPNTIEVVLERSPVKLMWPSAPKLTIYAGSVELVKVA